MALEPFSASAERGTTDRTWRSLVDTADQMDVPSAIYDSVESSPLPVGGTLATFGGTKDGKPLPVAQKRTFAGGLVAGVAVAAALGGLAFFMMVRKAPTASSPSPPPPEVVTAIPAASVTAPWTASPPAITSAAPVPSAAKAKPTTPAISKPKSAPSAIASTATSANVPSATPTPPVVPQAVERPNGAPILH
ncbi:MAG: hypothetical protein ABIP89_12095, partial [Polyangiaceae bacterium]